MSITTFTDNEKSSLFYISTIAGQAGIGKTTFATNVYKKTLLLDLENASRFLPIRDGLKVVKKKNIQDYKTFVSILESYSEADDFQSVVVDSLSSIMEIMKDDVLAEYKVTSLNKIAYGGGTTAMLDRTESLMNLIQSIRDKYDVHFFLLAHTKVKTFNDPQSESYDRYTFSMPDKVADKLKEQSDNVFYVSYRYFKADDKRAVSDGSRVMYTQWRPAFDAKSRVNLPFEIPFEKDGKSYLKFLSETTPKSASELKEEISQLGVVIKDKTIIDKINSSVVDAGDDLEKLTAIRNRVLELSIEKTKK